jgi:hypothetical protein
MNKNHLAEPIFFTPPPTKLNRRMWKGGGGEQAYYENLNALYGEQLAMGQTLRGVATDTVIPAYKSLVQSANEFDSIPNRELAAQRAMKDMTVAGENNLDALVQRIGSTGADITDENFLRQIRAYKTAQGAGTAQAGTQARNAREREGYARRQDAVSIGMGIPGQATASFNSAGNTANSAGRMNLAQQQQESDNWANIVQGGVNAYQIWKAKDGGFVSKKKLGIDGARRYAMGGVASGGFLAGSGAAPPMPASRPATPSAGPIGTAISGATGYGLGKKVAPDIGKGVEWMGNQAASPEMAAFGQGMQGMAPEVANQVATAQVSEAIGAADGLASAGAGAAAEAAAAESAAALATTEVGAAGMAGAASGLGAAGAAVGAAMPWVGAALLAGSALGLFKDGGRVNVAQGGEIDGPGGPEDDAIPAWLSDGEFVLNADAVQHFGLDRLEKMNQVGLEKRYGPTEKKGIKR